MPKKEDNALAGMVATLQTMWRHRRGNEIPGAILDTFDNLGYVTKDNRKPVLVATVSAKRAENIRLAVEKENKAGLEFRVVLLDEIRREVMDGGSGKRAD